MVSLSYDYVCRIPWRLCVVEELGDQDDNFLFPFQLLPIKRAMLKMFAGKKAATRKGVASVLVAEAKQHIMGVSVMMETSFEVKSVVQLERAKYKKKILTPFPPEKRVIFKAIQANNPVISIDSAM